VSYFPLPSDDPRCRRPDISRAKALLDWVPVVPVRQGIQATIDWFAGRQGGKLVPAQSDMIAAD
jgi:UDP-glucuronate decarboxylase